LAKIHNKKRIPNRPINPASSQILGRCTPQAPATRPNIKARTTGTRGLFTPVLSLVVSFWEECSSADGFSDMSLFPLSFKEIIPNSNYLLQSYEVISSENKDCLSSQYSDLRRKMPCWPYQAKNFLDKYTRVIE
jgi:hypothetical protein